MSRIFCLVGKSGAGKDTLYAAVTARYGDRLTPIVPCTTRPRRAGERNGENYFFVTEQELRGLEERGQVIEKRVYQTVNGPWTYFTRRFSLLESCDYIVITTLEGARSFIRAFGADTVRTVYLTLPDGQRLRRCLDREDAQPTPNYAELCRRYLADERDFSPEALASLPNLRPLDTSSDLADAMRQWEDIFNGE